MERRRTFLFRFTRPARPCRDGTADRDGLTGRGNVAGRRCALGRTAVLTVGLAATLTFAGCGPGSGPEIGLKSDDVAGRIPAIKRAAVAKDADAIPALVDHLESDDPAERMYAAEALKRITGQTMDYTYYGSDAERAEAISRWREWLKTHKS